MTPDPKTCLSAHVRKPGQALILITAATMAVYACLPGVLAQSPEATAAGAQKAAPELVRLTPGYNVPDDERDPFFPPPRETAKKETGPSAQELVATMKEEGLVKGLLGKPEKPETAGVLIGNKIYRINEFIPVKYNDTVYSLVLVSVKFPGTIELKYKDNVVPLALKQNSTKGN